MEISEIVQLAMERNNLKQYQVAEAIGIHQQSLNAAIKKGTSVPGKACEKLAELAGVPLAQVLMVRSAKQAALWGKAKSVTTATAAAYLLAGPALKALFSLYIM